MRKYKLNFFTVFLVVMLGSMSMVLPSTFAIPSTIPSNVQTITDTGFYPKCEEHVDQLLSAFSFTDAGIVVSSGNPSGVVIDEILFSFINKTESVGIVKHVLRPATATDDIFSATLEKSYFENLDTSLKLKISFIDSSNVIKGDDVYKKTSASSELFYLPDTNLANGTATQRQLSHTATSTTSIADGSAVSFAENNGVYTLPANSKITLNGSESCLLSQGFGTISLASMKTLPQASLNIASAPICESSYTGGLNFGTVIVNEESDDQSLVINNDGNTVFNRVTISAQDWKGGGGDYEIMDPSVTKFSTTSSTAYDSKTAVGNAPTSAELASNLATGSSLTVYLQVKIDLNPDYDDYTGFAQQTLSVDTSCD